MCAHDNYGNLSRNNDTVVFFDPKADLARLVDSLADQQAETLKINSNQLRRFFSEVKNLYNQYKVRCNKQDKQDVFEEIKPHFKMIRSKAFYASRTGGQAILDRSFKEFLDKSISLVEDAEAFEKFVMHFESVVGFMYGKGKVAK